MFRNFQNSTLQKRPVASNHYFLEKVTSYLKKNLLISMENKINYEWECVNFPSTVPNIPSFTLVRADITIINTIGGVIQSVEHFAKHTKIKNLVLVWTNSSNGKSEFFGDDACIQQVKNLMLESLPWTKMIPSQKS